MDELDDEIHFGRCFNDLDEFDFDKCYEFIKKKFKEDKMSVKRLTFLIFAYLDTIGYKTMKHYNMILVKQIMRDSLIADGLIDD